MASTTTATVLSTAPTRTARRLPSAPRRAGPPALRARPTRSAAPTSARGRQAERSAGSQLRATVSGSHTHQGRESDRLPPLFFYEAVRGAAPPAQTPPTRIMSVTEAL